MVLDGVDLRIGEGEVFALLGPNGAGKTTTVKILSTLIRADAGTASIMGHDLRGAAGAVRAVIGVTGQFFAVDKWLAGEENLLLMGRPLHLPAADRRARAAGLLEASPSWSRRRPARGRRAGTTSPRSPDSARPAGEPRGASHAARPRPRARRHDHRSAGPSSPSSGSPSITSMEAHRDHR